MGKTLLPFDEINALQEKVSVQFQDEFGNKKKPNKDELEDEILDLLIMSYVFGNHSANNSLGTSIEPNVDSMKDAIYTKIAGKTWKERIDEYINSGDVSAINKVIDTDTVRVYNEGTLWTAKTSKVPAMKTWETMLDDRVRDTHDYLEGVSVPVDAEFYTFDGDSARYPGDFTDPANNVNCRCTISVSKI